MMLYTKRYSIADPLINHLDTVISTVQDPFIISRYIGLVSITAVTVYELCMKDIFYEFGRSQNIIFGEFVNNHFERINGRIKLDDIRKNIKKFGKKYSGEFDKKLRIAEERVLRKERRSIKSSYKNIIAWRHQFAHEGDIVSTVTYKEATDSYKLGKEVMRVLDETMKR